MDAEVLKVVASQGPYAALFVGLLFYVLKTNAVREAKYQETISTLANGIQRDVTEIKDDLKTWRR